MAFTKGKARKKKLQIAKSKVKIALQVQRHKKAKGATQKRQKKVIKLVAGTTLFRF